MPFVPSTASSTTRRVPAGAPSSNLLAALAVCAGAGAWVQPAWAEEPWTDLAVRQRATLHSPAVQSAEADTRVAAAHGAWRSVPVVGNPVLGVRAMFGVPDDPAATYTLQVGVPFDVGRTRVAGLRETDARIRAAEARARVARNDAVTDARLRWLDACLSRESERNAMVAAETARELLQRTRSRLAAGAATQVDVALAERELAVLDAETGAARATRALADARLRDSLDLAVDAGIECAPLGAPPADEGTADRGSPQRAEADALRQEGDRAVLGAQRARAEAVSQLQVNAEVEMQGNTQRAASVGLSATWALPVARTAQVERAVGDAEREAAALRATLVTRSIDRERAGAEAELSARREELRILEEQAVPSATHVVELTVQQLNAGAVDMFRVLLARRELHDLRARRIQVLRAVWLARISLDHARGTAAVATAAPTR